MHKLSARKQRAETPKSRSSRRRKPGDSRHRVETMFNIKYINVTTDIIIIVIIYIICNRLWIIVYIILLLCTGILSMM